MNTNISSQQDIRWKQRFQNFEKAFIFLADALKYPHPNELEEAGIVKAYEFTFELAWKTLKDYLEENAVIAKFPREVIKEAFAYHILDDGDFWMDMLNKCNLMTHTYNETNARLALSLIRNSYFNELQKLYLKLKEASGSHE